ncbi:MAG: ATP phosphoribosyltransferase regulatory subunit [Alphaproteobacteria bacterium]|nr:ATP phosphoribosyltransferase regulatory subunit [Alphaproteobacteria bacterium]
MTGKSPDERLALDSQSAIMSGLFEGSGYSYIEPDILQPADVFLDRSGEDIRQRTYVFTDPAGNELCLRPDLTVPSCRYHLEHADVATDPAKYCYVGPAFRFQRGGASRLRPREFEQVGIENFGARDRERAEAETLSLAIDAVETAGLEDYSVQVGDLGLFDAVLAGFEMPNRWRARLHHQFWRPEAFRDLLKQLTTGGGPTHGLADELSGRDVTEAQARVDELLTADNIPLVGGRTVEEIAERLHEKAADRVAEPLKPEMAEKIEAYLAIRGAPSDVFEDISKLELPGAALDRALDLFAKRFVLLSELGVDTSQFVFSAEFGYNLEYYTGHVFQIDTQGQNGPVQVVGGGRYDRLMSDLGAAETIPAVGFAVHTERLAAITGGISDD